MPISYCHDGTSLKHKLAQLGFESYKLYLASQLWMSIRQRVYDLKGRTCISCQESPATAIHHTQYDMATLRGESLLRLDPICDQCHAIEHHAEIERRKRRKAGRRDKTPRLDKPPKGRKRRRRPCPVCASNSRKSAAPCCKSCARKIRRGIFVPVGDGTYRRVMASRAVRPENPVMPGRERAQGRLLRHGMDREYQAIVNP